MSSTILPPNSPSSPAEHQPAGPPASDTFVPRAPQRRRRRFLKPLLLTCAVVAVVGFGFHYWTQAEDPSSQLLKATVARAALPITVTERGELESSKTVDVRCEVEGRQNKIVEILDEGTNVTKDQVVVRFDTDELSRTYSEQEIRLRQAEAKAKASKEELEVEKNKAASEIAKAELALTLAKLDRVKYLEGEYLVEEDDLMGQIALAEHDLQEAQTSLENYRKFVKKGFGTPEVLRYRELAVERDKFYLNRDKAKLNVLQQFTRERQEVELKAKEEEAGRELVRAEKSGAATITKFESEADTSEVTAGLEKQRLEKLKKQLDNCIVKAPQGGILVYSKERYWDPNSRIRAGGTVHFQQNLFSLPDLNQMQVKVKVHESMIKKIKEGQKTEIRIDALPNVVLEGTVEKVATLADNARPWAQGGVKEYETIVKIQDVPTDGGLKPGMTAEVKVLVDKLNDILVVPVQSVTSNEGQHYAYVLDSSGVERRAVTIGENNVSHVEVTEGLKEGEQVALDARVRMANELKADGGGDEGLEESEPKDETTVADLQ